MDTRRIIPINWNRSLNRLLQIHTCSLPMYLRYATPWLDRGEEKAKETLRQIVADQEQMAERIDNLILENDGEVDSGDFPMNFTVYNDVAFGFLLRKLVERQKQDIDKIEQCIGELDDFPLAQSLAQEARGLAKRHLDQLDELQQEISAAKSKRKPESSEPEAEPSSPKP